MACFKTRRQVIPGLTRDPHNYANLRGLRVKPAMTKMKHTNLIKHGFNGSFQMNTDICEKPLKQIDAYKYEEPTRMRFITACIPYFSLVVISLILQIPSIKKILSRFYWGIHYPETVTSFGYVNEAVDAYSKIQWFSHPAPVLFASALIGYFLYKRVEGVKPAFFSKAVKNTIKKCLPTSAGIITMVMMALIMSDTGMTRLIALGISQGAGSFYPIASPFIGALGTFLTGSNTNSNVMFGLLQYETAIAIGKNGIVIAALQSVGGSLGVSISPATIMMGAANVGLTGNENKIMSRTLVYCMCILVMLGIVVFGVFQIQLTNVIFVTFRYLDFNEF